MFKEELNLIRKAEDEADIRLKDAKSEAKHIVENANSEANKIIEKAESGSQGPVLALQREGEQEAERN